MKTLIRRHIPFFTFAALALAPCLRAQDSPATGNFETPQVWPATSFLPSAGTPGASWRINPNVTNNGLYNTWLVSSSVGGYEVTGNERLVELIREIEATVQLQSISRTREFAEAMRDAGQAQLDRAVQVLSNPVETVSRIPQGASRFFGAVGGTIRNAARGELHTDPNATAGDTARRLIGMDRAKRALAVSLGVNPFTRNEALQKELTDVARVQSMGRLTMNVGTALVVPPGLGHTLAGINISSGLTQEQINATPTDLAASNRAKAIALGATPAQADALLANTWYDPWSLTAMLNALEQIQGVNMGPFIELSLVAGSDLDSFYFLRNAQIMSNLHQTVSPISSVTALRHTVACGLSDGGLMVPVWLDYAIWTPQAAQAADNLQAFAQTQNAQRVLIATTGFFSPVAVAEMQARGISVLPHSLTPAPPATPSVP